MERGKFPTIIQQSWGLGKINWKEESCEREGEN